MMLKEVHHLAFCPASIVSIWLCKKGAVAAVSGFQQGNVRISHDLRAGVRQQADKRIIGGMDHKSWDRDAERERVNRTRFAQRALKPDEVKKELEANSNLSTSE